VSSDLGQNTGYLGGVFLHGLPQFLHANSRILLKISHDRFLSNGFHFVRCPTCRRYEGSKQTHLCLFLNSYVKFMKYQQVHQAWLTSFSTFAESHTLVQVGVRRILILRSRLRQNLHEITIGHNLWNSTTALWD
jgi:hypothetical protein